MQYVRFRLFPMSHDSWICPTHPVTRHSHLPRSVFIEILQPGALQKRVFMGRIGTPSVRFRSLPILHNSWTCLTHPVTKNPHLPRLIFVQSPQPNAHKKQYLMEKMGVQLVCLCSWPISCNSLISSFPQISSSSCYQGLFWMWIWRKIWTSLMPRLDAHCKDTKWHDGVFARRGRILIIIIRRLSNLFLPTIFACCIPGTLAELSETLRHHLYKWELSVLNAARVRVIGIST